MVTTTAQWCDACSNSVDRGCAALEDAKLFGASMAGREGEAVSALGAGFIGAGVSIAVFATALGVLYFLGLLVFGRRKPTITKGYSIVSIENFPLDYGKLKLYSFQRRRTKRRRLRSNGKG